MGIFHSKGLLLILALTLYALICISHEAYSLELSLREQEYIANHKPIRVHNETDWPPFNFYEHGIPQGISIDVMNRVATLTGLRIQYVTGPSWDEFVAMMANGQLDVMLNIIDLPERKEQFQFTAPYVKSLTGVFVAGSHRHDIHSFDDLTGRTVAVPAGFDLEINMPKYHPEVRLLPVRDILECIKAVNAGKADAFMEEIGVANYIVSQRVIPNIHMAFQVDEKPFISNLTIGTRRDDPLLHSIIQKGLNAISGDELNNIRHKWLLQAHEIYEQSMINLSVQEKEYVYQHKTVRICVDPSWPPLDFIDKQGHHSGLSADLINTIAKRLNLSLQLVPTSTWEESLSTIREGACDIIPLMNETRESSDYLDFTTPYFNFATVIATRKDDASFIGDYSELYGKTIALQAYFFITEYVRSHHPRIQIIEVENTEEALKLVSEHKAFATIDSLPTIVNTIERSALENIQIVGSVPQQNSMKIGVRKEEKLLLSLLNKGVTSLSEQEKIGFYKKWLNVEIENHLMPRATVIRIVIVFFMILVFLLWRQLTLNRYTRKLQALNTRLQHASTIDHLTQVLNRKSIEQRLQAEMDRVAMTGDPLTLVICDIDHFKSINDSFGHLTGDRVLQKLAGHIAKAMRHSDHLGRWGGEEFLIILPGANREGGAGFTEKLRSSIESTAFGINKKITVSFGLGEYEPGEDITTFISRIDACLYEAKNKGRNKVVTAAPTNS